MRFLKATGYLITAILVISLIVGGVLLVTFLMTFGGVIAFILGAIVFIAYLIKEIAENASSKTTGK
jgi:hypothetical protein